MKRKPTKAHSSEKRRSLFTSLVFFVSLFTIHCALLTNVSAQDDDDPAPPPLKLLASEDRKRLEGAADPISQSKLTVDLMRKRIDAAERSNTANDFDRMFREFGYFRALLDYSLDLLSKQDHETNRTLDSYKRFELSLRAASPRIEKIRRELPLKYEDYVHKLLNYIRDARTKAIEPLFGNTVIPPEKLK